MFQLFFYGITAILFCFSVDLQTISKSEAYFSRADTTEISRVIKEFKEIGTVNSLLIEQANCPVRLDCGFI